MVTSPVDYKWSSSSCKVTGKHDSVVDFHSTYLAKGENAKKKRKKAIADHALATVQHIR